MESCEVFYAGRMKLRRILHWGEESRGIFYAGRRKLWGSTQKQYIIGRIVCL